MKTIRIILSCLGIMLLFSAPLLAESQCIVCHSQLGGKHTKIVEGFGNDIHVARGLSCHSCHGGDPDIEDYMGAKSIETGFVRAPSPKQTPAFCGKCHSDPAYMKKYNPSLPVDQVEKYYISKHGQRLMKGDKKVATCASCHNIHNIRPAKDPLSTVYPKNIPDTCGKCHSIADYMASYKIPTDQVEKYSKSVHGKALLEKGNISAPVCNDCHGNHGAIPPGVDNVALVCGLCHTHNMELFLGSPMAAKWKENQYHACATCHNHHDITHPTSKMLGAEEGVCRKCHEPSHKGHAAGIVMKKGLEDLENSLEDTKDAIQEAKEKGMDVTASEDYLQEARRFFYKARTEIHSFQAKKVNGLVGKGLEISKRARKVALKAARELQRRKIGLGVTSLLITFLIFAIYLKIRDIEKK